MQCKASMVISPPYQDDPTLRPTLAPSPQTLPHLKSVPHCTLYVCHTSFKSPHSTTLLSNVCGASAEPPLKCCSWHWSINTWTEPVYRPREKSQIQIQILLQMTDVKVLQFDNPNTVYEQHVLSIAKPSGHWHTKSKWVNSNGKANRTNKYLTKQVL